MRADAGVRDRGCGVAAVAAEDVTVFDVDDVLDDAEAAGGVVHFAVRQPELVGHKEEGGILGVVAEVTVVERQIVAAILLDVGRLIVVEVAVIEGDTIDVAERHDAVRAVTDNGVDNVDVGGVACFDAVGAASVEVAVADNDVA